MPVVANCDIDSPAKAAFVLARTGADAVMIGRAAQGRPWLFADIEQYLATGQCPAPPDDRQVLAIIREHLEDLHALYGEQAGVRFARKHVSWYLRERAGGPAFCQAFNQIESAAAQLGALERFLSGGFAGTTAAPARMECVSA